MPSEFFGRSLLPSSPSGSPRWKHDLPATTQHSHSRSPDLHRACPDGSATYRLPHSTLTRVPHALHRACPDGAATYRLAHSTLTRVPHALHRACPDGSATYQLPPSTHTRAPQLSIGLAPMEARLSKLLKSLSPWHKARGDSAPRLVL